MSARFPNRFLPLLRNLALLLLVASTLSGCLLTRVYAFKHQFCDFPQNFALSVDQEAHLLMRDPVLYDGDVVWLLGAEPTQRIVSGQGLEMRYVVEKDIDASGPRYSIPVSLRFARVGKRFRLNEGIIHQNLTTVLSPALIENTVQRTCDSTPSLLSRSVEVDLDTLERADLPSRADITEALGEPLASREGGRVLEYRFRFQDSDTKQDKTYATAWFDPTDDRLQRLQLSYFRYRLDADFVAKRARFSVHL